MNGIFICAGIPNSAHYFVETHIMHSTYPKVRLAYIICVSPCTASEFGIP